MTIRDIFEETYITLSAKKIRSGLTILGIVIGISSVISMIALGQGAQNSIELRIESIGANLLIVNPGAQRGLGIPVNQARGSAQTLTQEDADAIANTITTARAVAPELSKPHQVTTKGKNTNTTIIGTVPAYSIVQNLEIDRGTFVSDEHMRNYSKVAVLGPTARDDLFGVGATDVIGATIRILGIEFKVIGITSAKGGTGFASKDDLIFVPLSTVQRYLEGENYVTSISVQAPSPASMPVLQGEITALMLTRHKIANAQLADFTVLNQIDIISTALSVTQILSFLLGGVAGIALVVGGIGIMNMMLTSVTERTREIGLRKAIGAKPQDIGTQFLVEAVTLTFIGGVIGVALGVWIVHAFGTFGIIETVVVPSSVALAFGVCALIGILFGYYPARYAARLSPVDALRYE